MKDLDRSLKILFCINSRDALRQVRVALDFLWDDKTHTIHDKVAGDYDYEELMGTLLCAEAALAEYKADLDLQDYS